MRRISNSGYQKLLSKFRKPLPATFSDSEQFASNVMARIDALGPEVLSETEFKRALGTFRRSLVAVQEPHPSAEFRHSVMSQIRIQSAREYDAEESSILNELLDIADRIGVSLCSGSLACAGLVIAKIGLVPQIPMEQILILLA